MKKRQGFIGTVEGQKLLFLCVDPAAESPSSSLQEPESTLETFDVLLVI